MPMLLVAVVVLGVVAFVLAALGSRPAAREDVPAR